MDDWEALIGNLEEYMDRNESKKFVKVLRIAESVVAQDLAPFEIEFILTTLLQNPIRILKIVEEKRMKEEWDKCVTDAFKLLNNIIIKYKTAEIFYEDIVTLCLLPYDAKTRQLSLTCLTSVVRHSVIGARDFYKHVNALEETSICKAPLALLVGTVCEYHPEVVSEELMNKIWRLFLNMLDCNKHTVSVKKSVLQGVNSLFKHFSDELTTMELNGFYNKLVEYIKRTRIEDVCLSIFENYSHLFRERISTDTTTRKYLWILLNNNSNVRIRAAILSIYTVVVDTVSVEKLQNTVTELQIHINSHRFYEKFTALHALTDIHTRKGLGDLNEYVDIHKVEFEIRNGNVSYEICEAVTWCVNSKVIFSDRLLQTSLLCYESFPVNKRTDLQQCFVQADPHVRKSAVIILLAHTQSAIWRDLFDSTDNIIQEHIQHIAEDVQEYVVWVLENVGTDLEDLPDNVRSLLSVLTLASKHHAGSSRTLVEYAKAYSEVIPCAVLGEHFDENISIQYCVNDEDRLQASLSYIQTDKYDISEMIPAVETILSSNGIEASHLMTALKKLDKCIQLKEIDNYQLCDMINKINIISKRLDKSKKEDRILEREIIIFLGKHGRLTVDRTNVLENNLVMDLKINDNLKVNLQSVLNASIVHEDKEALIMLLNIIYNKLITKKDVSLQSALLRVIVSLSHCDVSCDVINDAVLLCDSSVVELLQYIIQEKSNKSRQTLLEALKVLLTAEESAALENVLENVLITEYSTTQAICDILELLIKILEENNVFAKKYLPQIIIKVVKLNNRRIFKMAAEIFTDKIELYDVNITDDMIHDMLNVDHKLMMRHAIGFVKNIFDKKKNSKNVTDYINNKNLGMLVEVKRVFELDFEKSMELVMRSSFIDDEDSYIGDESIFEFVGVFVDVLVENNNQKIYNLISKAIEVLTPQSIINKQTELSVCLSSLKADDYNYDIYVGASLEKLLTSYPVQEITDRIQRYLFERNDEVLVNAMKVIRNLGGVSPLDVKPWVDWIFKLHTSGFIERNLKSKMDYLCDLVNVSMRYLKQEEIQKLILEGDCIDGVNFFKTFMSVTYKYLISKPFILLLPGMEKCHVLLTCIVKYSVKRNVREEMEDVAELIISHNSILLKEKISLSVCLQTSLREEVIESLDLLELEDKIQVIMASNNKELKLYKYLIPYLPSRISELSGVTASCFRLILDMMDIHDAQLTSVLVTLAANDPTKGWWDDAIHMCMSTISKTINIDALTDIYRKCFDARSTSACERVLLPLLRYSKPSDCEEFFSINLENILAPLRDIPKTTSDTSYDRCVVGYIKALYVIQVIFEKVPKANIESPRSVLYNNYSGSNFISDVCKLCFTLRGRVDARYRTFHCANYNCLVSAICLRDPKPQIYATVFDPEAWKKIIDEEEIRLPIREQWNQRITRHATSSEISENHTPSLSLRTSSVRTRMFTRTLSEHPLQFDLLHEEDEVQPRELQLVDNPLNRHPCIASLTALLRKQKAFEGQVCRDALVKALESDEMHVNVKWLLTQAICNNREGVKAHANILQPALLSVITKTSKDNKLNGLHVDILDTLILWNENTETPAINTTIDCIIQTTIDYKQRKNVYAMLVDKLVKLLNIWPNVKISWPFFEKHFEGKNPDIVKVLFNLLKHIAKSNKYIPELLPALTKAVEAKRTILELSELYGIALSLEKNNEVWLKSFRSVLAKLRRSDVSEYVKLLFYVQKGYPKCCDDTNFRSIADLVPKLATGREKLHCLQILANCVEHATSDDVTDMFHTIGLEDYLDTVEGLNLAKNGLQRMPERIRKDIVSRVCDKQYTRHMVKHVTSFVIAALKIHLTPEGEPPAKKVARESKSLLLSNEYTRNALKVLTQGDVREVGEVLSEDLGVRLCESFYIAIILTKAKSEECLYVMLDLFFQGIKDSKKSRDETIVRSSTSSTTSLIKDYTVTDSNASFNKELTTDEILSSLLNFCKKNTQAALSIITQLMSKYARGTELASMSDSVVEALHRVYVMEIVRSAEIWDFDGLQQRIEGIIKTTEGTEAEVLSKLLYEDYKLRKFGPEQFHLGSVNNFDETMSEGSNTFCVEDLISAFGKLSNWDDLTLQQRRSIKQDLPCLWTTRDNFKASIQWETEEPIWLNALISTYQNKGFNCHNVYKWPKNYFDVSVIAETSRWRELREAMDCKNIIFSDIPTSDCMAQWAARIMMRSIFLSSLEQLNSDDTSKLSRSHAAVWCERASEMALHGQVLLCCKSVIEGIFESETLKWLRIRMLALRAIGLEKNDTESLKNTLNLAETYIPKFIENSSSEDIFGMRHVALLLRDDLKLLKKSNVEDILKEINKITKNSVSEKNRKNLEAICIFSMNFYDHLEGNGTRRDKRLLSMAKILSLYTKLGLGNRSTHMANVIINKLHQCEYSFTTNEDNCILDALEPVINKLNSISVEILKSRLHLLPEHTVKRELREQESKMEKYNKCLSLVGDPEYLLLHYCDLLSREHDITEWNKVFINMKKAIFENPYAGADYQVLHKHKEELYRIADYDAQKNKEILPKVMSQLKPQKRDYLHLSQLCPTLTRASEIEDNCLNELLNLKPGVNVVRFEEKILVFKDSVRRPSVLRCRLTDGRAVRCIVKRGEWVRTHCAAVAIIDVLGLKGGYRVTPLSEDCCLIEYLEHYERFRTLVYSAHPVDNIPEIEKRTKDSELVLDTKRSLQQYKDICNKVPPYILRSTIEAACVSVQDFIYKKKNFFECICDMSISSYVCDMSDRHLENLMYNAQDGGACHVDCGAMLQDGGRGELPPARLTRNILGLCDAQVLEGRLQNKLLSFRDNQDIVLPSISVIFTWMGQRDKLPYISDIVEGKTLSYHRTIRVLSESELADKGEYVKVLEEVFQDFQPRDVYSVEEQVSSLLRHSTDPRILSLTRSLWEPWV